MKAWENNIRRVEPYVPGEQPKETDIIKLNTNENPYPPAPAVFEELSKMDASMYRKYPTPTCDEIRETLAKNYGVTADNVFVGVGSDDVLSMVFLTFFNSGKPILFPDITYSFYNVWAEVYGIPYERPALDENFNIVASDYYKENGGVVIANPNAPTGIYRDLNFIRDILDHNQDVIVVVDEAYIDFAGASAVELLSEYDNLIVVQTFSKSKSMAGMRIGMAIASKELIKALNDVKYSVNSYTMNMPSILAGVESVKDREYFEATCKKIINTREEAKRVMADMGFEFPDSMSNFLFVTHKGYDMTKLYEYLRENNLKLTLKKPAKVTYHKPCNINNFEDIEWVLKNTNNLEYIEMKDYDKCCGLNGISKIKKYKIMSKIFKEKQQNIINTNSKTVLTSCLGCEAALKTYSFGKYKTYDLINFIENNI